MSNKYVYLASYNLYIDKKIIPKAIYLTTDKTYSQEKFKTQIKNLELSFHNRNLDVTISYFEEIKPSNYPSILVDLTKFSEVRISSLARYDFKENLIEIKTFQTDKGLQGPNAGSVNSSKSINESGQTDFTYFDFEMDKGTYTFEMVIGMDSQELQDPVIILS